jgi:transposase
VDTFDGAECAEEFTMPKRRHETHSRAFREEAIRQVRESRKPLTRLAEDLGVKYSTLRLWVKEAESPPDDELSEDDRGELRRLRAEVRQLRLEREILKKATAFFAKHTK